MCLPAVSVTSHSEEGQRRHDSLSLTASSSVNRENALQFRNGFAVLETVGQDSKRQRLSLGDGFIACSAVG